MGNRGGFYKSGKRNKELVRQKKQEEKRQRRMNKTQANGQETQDAGPEAPPSETGTEVKEE